MSFIFAIFILRVIITIDEKSIRSFLEAVPQEEFFDLIHQVLFKKKTKMSVYEKFLFKKIVLEELSRRGLVEINIIHTNGSWSKVNIRTLKIDQVNLILKRILYTRESTKCFVREIGGVEFLD